MTLHRQLVLLTHVGEELPEPRFHRGDVGRGGRHCLTDSTFTRIEEPASNGERRQRAHDEQRDDGDNAEAGNEHDERAHGNADQPQLLEESFHRASLPSYDTA